MDSKPPANLDPKLKEAYDRVMGMSSSNPAPSVPPITPSTPPSTFGVTNPGIPQPSTPPADSPFMGQPAGVPFGAPTATLPPLQPGISSTPTGTMVGVPTTPVIAPIGGPVTPTAPAPAATTVAATSAKPAKGGSKIMPFVFVFCGIIFLLAYTLFWIKILNLQLPFPLPF